MDSSDVNQKPFVLDKLVELSIIQSTESSNRIEGIYTSDTRIKDLVLKKVVPKNRDEEEILGYQDVLRTIHESFEYIDISSSIILQLHRDLYKFSQKSIGGRFKNTQNYISETKANGSNEILFTPLSPYETPAAIDEICKNYNQAIDDNTINPLILIPTFIHDFLCIHPFNDGNGRMSRLLTTLLLYKLGFFVGRYISLEEKIEKSKNIYYDVLEESGINWHENNENTEPFIKYILGIIIAAYRDFEDRVDIFSSKSSAYEKVQHAVKMKIGKFTKSDIMELCPSISSASIENSLTKLVEENILERHGKGRGTYYVKN
ncbi:Fic family protein [Treponema phagedenis]|uniref:Fic family protein n=1 Tax=Treponema phagedenis TaxID=162 RepID=A0AAE6IVP9_TREPH|nr:Fic family protein [Treponema phagedenis]QEJ94294.1 Fic family protein [Treponema phagedenis]QEJ99067.1 Fic family protein [Treponema phagedenis]QEK00255.1 Fic family protein [Treponema phagedenis]QEK04578.1 Fic family protein [Treponema phagedenis]QEK07747.1 Fic family protein [Treponema phagedenis]